MNAPWMPFASAFLLLLALLLSSGCAGLQRPACRVSVWDESAAVKELTLTSVELSSPALPESWNRQIREIVCGIAADHGFLLLPGTPGAGRRTTARMQLSITEHRCMHSLSSGYSSAVSALLFTPDGRRGAHFFYTEDTEHGFSSLGHLYRMIDTLFTAMKERCTDPILTRPPGPYPCKPAPPEEVSCER
jgi:hypothetical protein